MIRPSFLPILLLAMTSRADAGPPVTALAFAPDGRSVAVGSQAGIEVRSWPELAPLRRVETTLRQVHDLAFAPAGDALAAAGGAPAEEGAVELFGWPSGDRLWRSGPHADLVHAVAWSPDGSQLATAGADAAVLVLRRSDGEAVGDLAGHSRPVLAAAFLPDGRTLVTGGIDLALRAWEAAEGRPLRGLTNHTGPIRGVAVRPGDRAGPALLASIGADRTVRFWQPAIGRMVRLARLPTPPLAAAWTPDGARLAVSCTDGRLRLIDPERVAIVLDRPAVEGWAHSVAVAPDGRAALVGGEGGALAVVPLDAGPGPQPP